MEFSRRLRLGEGRQLAGLSLVTVTRNILRKLIVRNGAYAAWHGYRTLPEHRHRLSGPGRPRRLLRHHAGLENRGPGRLGRHPRGLRPVHLLPAGGGLRRAQVAGPGTPPADAPRRGGRRPRYGRGRGDRPRRDQARAPARHHLPGAPRPGRTPVLPVPELTIGDG